MRRPNPFPARKSRLNAQGKTIIAAMTLLDVMEEKLDEKSAGIRLRSEVGLNWSLLTAMQYLSGKEALAVISQLPESWSQDGRDRRDVMKATLLAADAVANVRPDGQMMCASDLAASLKR